MDTLAALSVQDLTSRLDRLDAQFEVDLAAFKKRYAASRAALVGAIERRNLVSSGPDPG